MNRTTTCILLAASWLLGGCPSPSTPSTQLGAASSSAAANPPAAASGPLALPAGTERAAQQITEQDLRATVAALAADRLEGRGPGTSGDEAARRWLAAELQARGCDPGAGNGSWEQPFDIVGIAAQMPKSWRFDGVAGGTLELAFRTEFMAASGVQQPRVEVRNAEIVFVGYGIMAPEQKWDDFKGADVSGKVLLMLNDDPSWDSSLFAGERRLFYGRWVYKYESAAAHGAAGAIIIHTTESAGYPWQVVETSWSGEQFELPAGDEPRAPIQAWVTESAARRLVGLGNHELDALVAKARSRDFRPVPLGVRTSLSFDCKLRQTKTANVLGVQRGSDPSLAATAMVYSAHHDHLGIGEPDDSGDRIYNGARDNGIAVAQALSVARAFSALPQRPARSRLFVLVGAEEQGLLGSRYFTLHPTFPASRMAANINFELGNIWGRTRNVVIHGKGKNSLDQLLEAAARMQNRVVEDEPDPRSGWYYRSDQFSFARIGVPSVWFESGRDFIGRPAGWGDEQARVWVAERYHQPNDELTAQWRFDGAVEDGKLGFYVGLAVASSSTAPTWMAGDEFANIRRLGQ